MDLVERYVHAVGTYLPRAQRDDIVAKLADDVRSQIDDREAHLGRALTDAEVEAILMQCGHPRRVATQYLPQRWLIGPAPRPSYVRVLKIVLAVVVGAVALVIPPMRVLQGVGLLDALARSASDLWFAIWIPLGNVTIIFAAVERSPISQTSTRWSPRRLACTRATGDPNVIPHSDSIAQGVRAIVYAFWWLAGAPFPFISAVALWRCGAVACAHPRGIPPSALPRARRSERAAPVLGAAPAAWRGGGARRAERGVLLALAWGG